MRLIQMMADYVDADWLKGLLLVTTLPLMLLLLLLSATNQAVRRCAHPPLPLARWCARAARRLVRRGLLGVLTWTPVAAADGVLSAPGPPCCRARWRWSQATTWTHCGG
jgi:hypothetical protein